MTAKSDAKTHGAPSDPVRRWTLIVLGLIVILFLYSLIADRLTPYTSQATVQAFIVRMAPEVAGRVIEVNVVDNQKAMAGDVLFRIDPQPFEIALQQADAKLAGVGQASERAPRRLAQHRNGWSRHKPSATTRANKSRASSSSLRRVSTPKLARTKPRHRSSRPRPASGRPRPSSNAPSKSSDLRARTIRNSGKRSPLSRRQSSTSSEPRSRRLPMGWSPICS